MIASRYVIEARVEYVTVAAALLERSSQFEGKDAEQKVAPDLAGKVQRTTFFWQDESTVDQDQHEQCGYSN